MAFTPCTVATNNIASLDDLPNDVGGLSSAQLKAAFDKFGVDLVAFLNTYTIAEANAHLADTANPHKTPVENVLHNYDFRNLRNQRAASSYTVTGGWIYSIDRWKLNNAALSITSGTSITITGTGSYGLIAQYVENYAEFAGETLTFSVEVLGGTGVGAGAYISVYDGVSETTTAISATGITTVTKTMSASTTQLSVTMVTKNTSGYTLLLKRCKLERGSISTLINDAPADPGKQLALCRRYTFSISSAGGSDTRFPATMIGTNTLYFVIPVGVAMRISPSLESGVFAVVDQRGGETSGFTFSVGCQDLGYIIIIATKSSHGLSLPQYLKVTTTAIFSADLS